MLSVGTVGKKEAIFKLQSGGAHVAKLSVLGVHFCQVHLFFTHTRPSLLLITSTDSWHEKGGREKINKASVVLTSSVVIQVDVQMPYHKVTPYQKSPSVLRLNMIYKMN